MTSAVNRLNVARDAGDATAVRVMRDQHQQQCVLTDATNTDNWSIVLHVHQMRHVTTVWLAKSLITQPISARFLTRRLQQTENCLCIYMNLLSTWEHAVGYVGRPVGDQPAKVVATVYFYKTHNRHLVYMLRLIRNHLPTTHTLKFFIQFLVTKIKRQKIGMRFLLQECIYQ